jgi:hypothetical protein
MVIVATIVIPKLPLRDSVPQCQVQRLPLDPGQHIIQPDAERESIKVAIYSLDVSTRHLARGLPAIKRETNGKPFCIGNIP